MALPRCNSKRIPALSAFWASTAAVALAGGCSMGPRAVKPVDFARADASAVASGPTPGEASGLDVHPPAAPATARAAGPVAQAAVAETRSLAAPAANGPLVLDALVGQINGRPVFADALLADLDAQLAALGRRLEPATFRTRAAELIEGSLRERLVNALILGEAERALSENQQAGVRFMVAERREDLLRRHGRGSLAVARKTLLEDTGLSLDETLRQYRDGLITDSYIRQNLNARINVSRREVERFYRDNLDTFQPPAKRDLGLVWVDDADVAAAVRARLERGEPFAEVAADPAVGNAWAGGEMTNIVGDKPFGRPAVDNAVAGLLEVGAWAGPIAQPGPDGEGNRFWFVHATKAERPEGRNLLEAQADIELSLREREFLRLRQRFIDRLLREGSHTPIDEMAEAVLQIAINRYSRPEA